MITITITDPVQVAGAVSIAGSTAGAQAYLQNMIETMCSQWAESNRVGTISSGDFVLRFTAQEFAMINAAAGTDPHIAGFIGRVRESEWVVLYSAEVVGGMQYLVEVELLTQERAAQIIAWAPVDEPAPEPVEPEGEE